MVQVKLFLVLLMAALATCTLSAQTTLNDKVAQKAAKGDSQSQYQMGLRYYNGDAETQTKTRLLRCCKHLTRQTFLSQTSFKKFYRK